MIELKDVLETLDLTPEKLEDLTIEQVQEHVQKTFIARSVAHEDKELSGKIVGKVLGSLSTKLKNTFGMTEGDIKDKKIEDIIEAGSAKIAAERQALEAKLGEGNDKKITDALAKLEAKEKEVNEWKTLAENNGNLLTEKEKEFNSKISNFKLQHKEKELQSKLQFKDGISDFEKAGFEAVINNKYKRELDEAGEIVVLNATNGEKILNKKGTGFATFADILEEEAAAGKLLKMNNTGGTPPPKTPGYVPPVNTDNNQPARTIAPRW